MIGQIIFVSHGKTQPRGRLRISFSAARNSVLGVDSLIRIHVFDDIPELFADIRAEIRTSLHRPLEMVADGISRNSNSNSKKVTS